MLYRTAGQEQQLVLLSQYQTLVLKHPHNDSGHVGAESHPPGLRLLLLIFHKEGHWGLYDQELPLHQTEETSNTHQSTNGSITTCAPLELVSTDYMHQETSKRGYEYILVVIDHFTSYAQVYPWKKSGRTAAEKIFNNSIPWIGYAARLHYNQSRNFQNNLGYMPDWIVLSRTTPYHPLGNLAKRLNRTERQMLRTQKEKEKTNWKEHLSLVVHAYNCTRCEATRFPPHYLMFDRQTCLPVDCQPNSRM